MRQQGFTLIELLVVVVIIGILASVAVPNLAGVQDNAKNAGMDGNVHAVRMALEQYRIEHDNVYPDTLAPLLTGTDYFKASGYPRTPWNQVQPDAALLDIPEALMTAARNTTVLGPGTLDVASWTSTHYGAVCYSRTGTANDQYDLVGVGKRSGNAVKVSHLKI